jgi:DUF3108-like
MPLRSRAVQFESLEARRLMSISATTFFGPPTIGTKWVYDATVTGGSKSTHAITVAGTAKVAGVKTLHLKTSFKTGATNITGSAYNTVDNVKGVVQYKAKTTTVSGTNKTSVTTLFDPPAVSCPSKLVAGKKYSFTWKSTTDTVVGTMHQNATALRTFSIKLLSETPVTIKVPAGTFAAYPIRTTTKASAGGTAFTTTNDLWVVKGIGMVKSITTSAGVTTTGVLASFQRG